MPLSAEQTRQLAAICERILPPGPDGPSASEAHVVDFISAQLTEPWGRGELMYREGPFLEPQDAGHGWQSPLAPADVYEHGLAALDGHARTTFGAGIENLTLEQLDELIHAWASGQVAGFTDISAAGFFAMVRQNVVEGLLSDPVYGGNRGMVGWRWLGYPGVAQAHGDVYTAEIERHGDIYAAEPRHLGWRTSAE